MTLREPPFALKRDLQATKAQAVSAVNVVRESVVELAEEVAALPGASDGDPPDNAPTLVFIGGIGSVFFRWSEVTNADPVTYRLYVRAGSAPTTADDTYEVAAGAGLTAASLRKLKDGTAIVGDGTVTYYGIVVPEDVDGVGPASNTASGVPAQASSGDIEGTVTGKVIQTADTGSRVVIRDDASQGVIEFWSGLSGESPALVNADTQAGIQPSMVIGSGTTPSMADAPLLLLVTGDTDGDPPAQISMFSEDISFFFGGDVVFFGGNSVTFSALVNGTMDTGSVGTGSFAESASDYVFGVGDAQVSTMTSGASPTSTTNVTLAGMSITVTSTGTGDVFRVDIDADVQITTAGTINEIELLVDGTPEAAPVLRTRGAANTLVSGHKFWFVTGLAAGSHTLTARTHNTAAATGATVAAANTYMSAQRIK